MPPGRAACGILAALAAAVALSAQSPAPAPQSVYRIYLVGTEVGQETDAVTVSGATRTLDSTVVYRVDGAPGRLHARLDSALDLTPKQLALDGQKPREGRARLDVTIDGSRARVTDGVVASVVDTGGGSFFPLDGPLPIGLQEQLIRYWRSQGRPPQIASAPGGSIQIEVRANEAVDLAGRAVELERLSISGPAWGRETVWVEPVGTIAAAITLVGGVPLQAVRPGFESRMDRFNEEALSDRLVDADRAMDSVPPDQPGGVVLTDATVIVGGKRPPITGATVVVREGRIAAVGPTAKIRPPADLPVIDARGMTIVAGLWDLHGVISQVEQLPIYLAAGVTTVRNAAPDPSLVSALQTAMDNVRAIGPRLIPAAFIDGAGPDAIGAAKAGTSDEARQAVRKARGDGVRGIELGAAVNASVFRAVALEAHRAGLNVAGRVPDGMTAVDAIDTGLDQVEGVTAEMVASNAGAFFAGIARRQIILEPQAARAELLRAPVLTAAAAGGLRVPASLARRYASVPGEPSGRTGLDLSATLAGVRSAYSAGVRLAAGSGSGLPALGVLRELELYVQAGVPPADALQSATSGAAQMFKMDDAGTVEAGKRADLLILSANPLDDISNLRKARWVVVAGKLYDCDKLWKAAGFAR